MLVYMSCIHFFICCLHIIFFTYNSVTSYLIPKLLSVNQTFYLIDIVSMLNTATGNVIIQFHFKKCCPLKVPGIK